MVLYEGCHLFCLFTRYRILLQIPLILWIFWLLSLKEISFELNTFSIGLNFLITDQALSDFASLPSVFNLVQIST